MTIQIHKNKSYQHNLITSARNKDTLLKNKTSTHIDHYWI